MPHLPALTDLETLSIPQLAPLLLDWYDKNARSMPWRGPHVPPYHTWVSEIMLQQTRVEAVTPYFYRFIQALPTIAHLAEADEDLLHKLWQGLGYYNRVKNMRRCAQELVLRFDGQLPNDVETLKTLPGIGEYTAGAIAAIAFGQRVPAVDGNVLRVLSRVTGNSDDIRLPDTLRSYRILAGHLVPEDRPGDFDQALMELGALVCMPNGAPRCQECPLQTLCQANLLNLTDRIPVRSKPPARRREEKTVLFLFFEELIYLTRRPDTGLLSGLWEPLVLSGRLSRDQVLHQLQPLGALPDTLSPLGRKKHIFTHVEWWMTGWKIRLSSRPETLPGVWASPRALRDTYAVPGAYIAFLEEMGYESTEL